MTKAVNEWGGVLHKGYSFSSCCGTRFATTKAYLNKPTRYIKMGVGVMCKPGETEDTTSYVVETKNGPLSLSIRSKW